MAEGILRNTTVGIADEATWGTAPASADYVLNVLDYDIPPAVDVAENESFTGSNYRVNHTVVTGTRSDVSITFKLDENSIPLILKNNFTISSAAASGETTVYDHTLTYTSSNSPTSFSLFIDDAAVGDRIVSGVRFSEITFGASREGFITVTLSGQGKAAATGTVTNAISAALREFMGGHTSFTIGDFGGSETALGLLSSELRITSELSGDDFNYSLGSTDLAALYLLTTRIELDASVRLSNYDLRDDFIDGQLKQSTLTITDTSRFVTGSVASTRPSVEFTFPAMSLVDWDDDRPADELGRFDMTLLALDRPGVATAPAQIVVTNNVASYA